MEVFQCPTYTVRTVSAAFGETTFALGTQDLLRLECLAAQFRFPLRFQAMRKINKSIFISSSGQKYNTLEIVVLYTH